MLALTPLNTAALNSAAVSPLISVFAAEMATASATLSGGCRVRGLHASGSAAATAFTSFGRIVGAAALVAVSAGATGATSRGMLSSEVVTVSAAGSIPSVAQLYSEVSVTVSAAALIGGKFLASSVAVSAQATDSATRARNTLATAPAGVSQVASLAKRSDFRVSPAASAVATPVDVDTITDGVRAAALSAQPTVGATAVAALLRTGLLSTSAAASTWSVSAASRLRPFPAEASVSVVQLSNLTVRRPDGAEGLASVTAQAAAIRTAGLRAAGSLVARANLVRVAMSPAAIRAQAGVVATASGTPFDRTRGMVSAQSVLATPAAELRVQTPELLFAVANATGLSTQAVLAISSAWSAQASAVVTGVGDLRTNVFDDEPDYRSFVVPRQEFVFLVPRQEFTAYISSDAQPMITFTKQPAERLAYDFEFLEWFEDLEGDDIEAASVEVISASTGTINDLVVEQPLRINSPSTRVKIWIEGGVNGARYKLTLTIDTEGGRRKTVDFYIRVKEL